MATFIALGSFTDQGIRNVKDSTKRAESVREMAKKFGITMKDIYWTLGQYDVVTIIDAPSDEVATSFALAIGAAGNVRTQSLRAFSRDEMNAILGKL
ncbi:MAG: GYD domain-containing protein [Betaproteobacteria bacterium]|nr:GYD domain-containing protein [Betaproteobacteria bacterium]